MRLQQTPIIGRLFRHKPTYYHYLDNPWFTCEYPRKWGDGTRIPGGVEFREPENRARFSIAYIPRDDPEYRDPDRYRRDMAAWGSVEDAHRVLETQVSSRTAYAVQFTNYEYDPEYLLGQKVDVRYVEAIMVPLESGMYVLRYQADKNKFWAKKFRKPYEYFLQNLILIEPKKQE